MRFKNNTKFQKVYKQKIACCDEKFEFHVVFDEIFTKSLLDNNFAKLSQIIQNIKLILITKIILKNSHQPLHKDISSHVFFISKHPSNTWQSACNAHAIKTYSSCVCMSKKILSNLFRLLPLFFSVYNSSHVEYMFINAYMCSLQTYLYVIFSLFTQLWERRKKSCEFYFECLDSLWFLLLESSQIFVLHVDIEHLRMLMMLFGDENFLII